MNRLTIAAITGFTAVLGWASPNPAMAENPKATPVDFRACNFRSGKSMADLDLVAAKFRQYANKNDFSYSAWILMPQYHNGATFDVGWLGAWPDGEAFGVSMESWRKTGRGLQAEFDQVIDCSGRHEMAGSWPINAPEGTPVDGVLMFYQCTLIDGKTLPEAYAAHLEAGTAMKALGSLAFSWFYQPVIGAGDIDHDYYHVVGFHRYSDMGATMEMYANGGGRQKQLEFLSSVATCETPTLFDVVNVRARDER
jgi:hypothetical protein